MLDIRDGVSQSGPLCTACTEELNCAPLRAVQRDAGLAARTARKARMSDMQSALSSSVIALGIGPVVVDSDEGF